MDEINPSNSKAQLLCLFVLIVIVMSVCFSFASSGSDTSSAKDYNNSVSILDQTGDAVRNQILRVATKDFQTSLEMKENVDFLLTPALLVQQAISDDVVITYPSE